MGMKYYTNEKNTLILISLLKQHGIRKIVVSPGSTNISFVASVQQDSFFEMYSVVDERSAAYVACGLAVECGEPVVLSCTGATASRNYVSALTEAFYRKIPILAVTSTQSNYRIGHHMQQVVDRTQTFNDIVKKSVQIPIIHENDDEEAWACNVMINNALLELTHRGGGPCHINLTTTYSNDFSVKSLPNERMIKRVISGKKFPDIPNGRVGILVGAHVRWSAELVDSVEKFCKKYNGVVLCDHNSNYNGDHRILANIVCNQDYYVSSCRNVDLMIHIGEISASWIGMIPKQVWRISEDGEVRDTFKKLSYVFEMSEQSFFDYYTIKPEVNVKSEYYEEWKNERERFVNGIPELPFSNAWVAKETSKRLPEKSVLHLGILNSLRVWNFFDIDESILCYSNTGGFGIDGCVSSLIGASLQDDNTLYFGVVGDLAFFYDMNILGNKHIGCNLRIMVINNGLGAEFTNYNNRSSAFGEDAEKFIAAGGHFGGQSPKLIKDYAENLGFLYISASNKEEFIKNLDVFVDTQIGERPVLFEVFTDPKNDSDAIESIQQIGKSVSYTAKEKLKGIIGEQGVRVIKNIVKK